MTALRVVSVTGDGGEGAELDRVMLDDEGRLAYRTGAARDLFEGRRRALGSETTDQELAEQMTGWSNGYIAVRAADGAGEPEG